MDMDSPDRSTTVPQTSSTSLEVPGLGHITGISYNQGECSQFLGIPYAKLPGRFRRATLAEGPWPGKSWDGTKLGPYCPQPPRDFYPVPSPPPRTWVNTPTTSELDCLNLNISVPQHDASQHGHLPVMVFFHGGAYTYSTGSSPIYDGRLMSIASALDLQLPTIIVTLNYRLGVYGFLGGTDLQAYAGSVGEEGCGNYGMWDQVVALQWIQRHISAFGGDPGRVCIFGQSAGSRSVACHMDRGEPLFESAIMQSGVLALCGIMTPQQYQIVFEKLLRELGISLELGSIERVQALAAVSEEKLTQAMVPVFGIPVITMALCDDGVLLPDMARQADYRNFSRPDFAKRLMIGDALHECIIWNKSWNHMSAPELLERMRVSLGDAGSKLVAELYAITPDMTAKQTFDAMERLTTDAIYRIANHFAMRTVPTNTYGYHFNTPSQYDNEWKGLCHHSYDNVLIWRNLEYTLTPAQKAIGKQMMAAWIKFANGLEPWNSYEHNQELCIFGPEHVEMKTLEAHDAATQYRWNVLDKHDLIGRLSCLGDELCIQRETLLRKTW